MVDVLWPNSPQEGLIMSQTSPVVDVQKVAMLQSMGFTEAKSLAALQLTDYDVDRAVLCLLRDGTIEDSKTPAVSSGGVASPSSPSEKAKHEGWTCADCTYQNAAGSLQCGVCGHQAPTSVIVPPGHWQCTICTVAQPLADLRDNKCGVCGAVKDIPAKDANARTCEICLDDHTLSQFHPSPCGHLICKACFKGYLNDGTMSGKVLELRCPHVGCARAINQDEASAVLDTTMLEKYKKFRTNALLSRDPNVRWCPTPGCETPLVQAAGENKQTRLTCGKCKAEASSTGWIWIDKARERKDKAASIEADFEKLMRTNKEYRQCAQCRNYLVKAEGCDKMRCVCGYKFCYACGQKDATCRCSPGHGFMPPSAIAGTWTKPAPFANALRQ